jgi:hypothetical protein
MMQPAMKRKSSLHGRLLQAACHEEKPIFHPLASADCISGYTCVGFSVWSMVGVVKLAGFNHWILWLAQLPFLFSTQGQGRLRVIFSSTGSKNIKFLNQNQKMQQATKYSRQ